jgi:hypothetical protein
MKSLIVYLNILILVQFGQILASTSGIIAVISSRQTLDGRPLLWQNFDSENPDVQFIFFKGLKYDYIGLVNGQDTSLVYSGLNTAGFGIVINRPNPDSTDSRASSPTNILKDALATCGNVEDFERLLQKSALIESNASIACIDAYGGSVLHDAGGRLSAADPVKSPEGFLVRSNFSFHQKQEPDAGFWRYHKSRMLLKQTGRSTHVKNIIQTISRNIETMDNDPYPLPFKGQLAESLKGYVRCEQSINQHNTVASVVIHGVRPQENPDFATLWATLGEPLCGVAVPIWPVTGESPYECRGESGTLNMIIRSNERAIYNKKKYKSFADTKLFVHKDRGMLPLLESIENKIFNDTQKALVSWRQQSDYLDEMIDFQTKTSTWTSRSIKY